jgi:aspartyl-tRNA(Asn)/glutamyl-tRNA(Gln) amidotransferase subunit B
VLTQEFVDGIKATLPELPDARKKRFTKDYGLTAYDAGVLVAEKETAEFFETVAKGRDAREAVKLVTGDFFAMLNRRGASIAESPISAGHLGKLLDLQKDGTISGRSPRTCSSPWRRRARDPAVLVEERGLKQVTDSGPIEADGQGGDRGQSGQGRGLQGQADNVRLVRRPGDEGDRRQGQSRRRSTRR